MSHWRGTWRKKEYESVEKRVIKHTQFYDVNSINIGKNDEQLLRIYYFRNHRQKLETIDIANPLKAKKQWQKLVDESNESNEAKMKELKEKQDKCDEMNEKLSQNKSQSQNNIFNSSSSQFSNLSSFSNKKKFEKF